MRKPEELVARIDRSIFAKALVISIVAHAALMGATSVSLFQDWMRYGFHSPSYINAEKTRERREAEETRRREATAEKANAEAEAKKAAGETNQVAAAVEPAKQTVAAEEAAAAKASEEKTPPEVQPLPPKKEFQYGDDLTLD